MQSWGLTVDKFLDHAKKWHGQREIVTRSIEGPITRTNYFNVHERAKKLSSGLIDMGIKPGDRVGTLAWNTSRHLEVWFGTMGIGAVCHTLNPRFTADQLAYIINHASDLIIFTEHAFLQQLESIRERIPSVEKIIVLSDSLPDSESSTSVINYESLIDGGDTDIEWGNFPEDTAAGLCYTSGTVGNPKGVLYSHRSNVLHTLASSSTDIFSLSARDVVLISVPMFHANAWGLTFLCPAMGAKMVLPGQKLDGPSLHELIETEGVTFSAAVPTVWQMLLTHLRQSKSKLTSLTRILVGGAAVPASLARAYQDEFGVKVIHAWGMTEVSPIGTVNTPTAETITLSEEEQFRASLNQGRATMLTDIKIVDQDGEDLPHDGLASGRLMVRGPYVVDRYFGDAADTERLDDEGYFDTGDIATIDKNGFMKIVDRSKDIIKSGGEWISSAEIETLILSHPHVDLAAVIGIPHEKWTERPLLVLKLKTDAERTKESFLSFLDGKVAKWWVPDDVVFVNDMPVGPTGKIDKKLVRQSLAGYKWSENPATHSRP
ncbi:long-chain-fatty-acid--CoA ligase [Hyphococcus sp. DH-69]|uniref:long-chain-fatty-acid--CoA ligase n=1 Tax=Hyphococcus formosus TaxID=3143534 RepID=UPI00398B83A4